MARGRPRKWSVDTKLTAADVRLSALLHSRYGSSNAHTVARVVREFDVWCRDNRVNTAKALDWWSASLLNAGLSLGSIKTYLGYVVTAHPILAAHPAWASAYKCIKLAHADAQVREARRISWSDARRLFDTLKPGKLRTMLLFIAYTGLRRADLTRLRGSQIKIDAATVVIRVKVAKARRTSSQSVTLRIAEFEKIFGVPVPVELTHYGTGDERPFSDVACNEINAILAEASAALWPRERPATSYSLRKLFIATILSYCRYDVDRAKEYTLHLSGATLQAYYDTLF